MTNERCGDEQSPRPIPLPQNTTPEAMASTPAAAIPRHVAWLGYGGLLPFLVLGAGSVLDGAHGVFWNEVLVAYGAVILSFVGALHWAFAMTLAGLGERQRRDAYVWSVVPALVGWVAILLAALSSLPVANVLLVLCLLAHYVLDRGLAALGRLPAWYLPLRRRLTVIACLCLAAGAFAAYLQPPAIGPHHVGTAFGPRG